jgi:hypothetical protein
VIISALDWMKKVCQPGHQQHDCADEEELAHRRQVALDDRRQRGHAQEDGAGPGEGGHDQRSDWSHATTPPCGRGFGVSGGSNAALQKCVFPAPCRHRHAGVSTCVVSPP